MSGHMDETCDQAVVMGSSMAGLLAARVLSERFERVVVIERDPLPPIGEHRRGVPHGRHLHGLHPRGREILDELFPGFTEALTTDGAVGCDVLGDLRWQLSGHQLRKAAIGLPALFAAGPSWRVMSGPWSGACPESVFTGNARSAALPPPRTGGRSPGSRFARPTAASRPG